MAGYVRIGIYPIVEKRKLGHVPLRQGGRDLAERGVPLLVTQLFFDENRCKLWSDVVDIESLCGLKVKSALV